MGLGVDADDEAMTNQQTRTRGELHSGAIDGGELARVSGSETASRERESLGRERRERGQRGGLNIIHAFPMKAWGSMGSAWRSSASHPLKEGDE